MSNICTIFMLFRAFWMSYVPEISGYYQWRIIRYPVYLTMLLRILLQQ